MLGRRRFLRGIHSRNHAERANAERMARNTPIQGTAADIIKMAMVRIQQQIEERELATRMLLTVHDEVVLDVPRAERSEVSELVVRLMEQVVELRVPLVVDVGFGEDWGKSHP